jgi:dGTPase
MEWEKLLNPIRIRDLFGAGNSVKSTDDLRSEFDRDYGRTIFSTPIRRLQDKAQVFPLVNDDFVRTRLTHSMEVSSVARGLGALTGRWLVAQGELSGDHQSSIEVIAATCGMLHDLGNPPFGHAGEQAICEWCKTFVNEKNVFGTEPQLLMDFLGWNGNAQTIRLIGKLQVLSDKYGLNLTSATMSAACKYVAPSSQIKRELHDQSKVGFFFSERMLIERVREATETGEARHPLTFLVEASDDIVYACVDLEDGIKKRLITWNLLEEKLLAESNGCEHTKKAIALAKKKIGASLQDQAFDEGMIQAFRTYAIISATAAAFEVFKKSYALIMDGQYHLELVKQSSAWPLINACKIIGRKVVYESDEVLRVELMGRTILQGLLSIFWEGADGHSTKFKDKPFAKKSFALMSGNYRKVFEEAIQEIDRTQPNADSFDLYCRMQLICDYVAGMTDSFATRLHKKLTNV